MSIVATLRFRRFASVLWGQRRPWTNTASQQRGRMRSGWLESSFRWRRKRRPGLSAVWRTMSPSPAFCPLIPAIISLRCRLPMSSAMTFNRVSDPAGSVERTRLGDGTNHPPVLANRAIRAAVRIVAASGAFGDSLNLALIRGVTPCIFSTAGSAPAERRALITVTSALFSATK